MVNMNNGRSIPQFGLGTWLSEQNTVQTAVEYAIDIGYRHIDCAWIYENEQELSGKNLVEFMWQFLREIHKNRRNFQTTFSKIDKI